MKILFVGCIEISQYMLDKFLKQGEDVCGIVCIPERFKESTSGYVDLSEIAEKHGIPCFKSRRLHIKKCVEFIKNLNPDLMVVYGWQRIIKPEVLKIPKLAIGFHASFLPKYRGSAPVNWAIINGETKTGITMFELTEGVDEGPIYGQKAFPIHQEDTCATVYKKSARFATILILEELKNWKKGIFNKKPNPSSSYPIMPRRRPNDGLIDWSRTTKQNYDWVRALTKPYPGAFTYLNDKKIIIWEAKPLYRNPDESEFAFKCSDGHLLVTKYEVIHGV